MWIVAVVYRFKYYFAWAVSECALILSGFCFNGWDDKGDECWDRYSNTRISHVEFATSAAELPAHWNTCTGNFLRRCEDLTLAASSVSCSYSRESWT
jgi:lysophospholipid acyltransferase